MNIQPSGHQDNDRDTPAYSEPESPPDDAALSDSEFPDYRGQIARTPDTPPRRKLNLRLNSKAIARLLQTGQRHDINRGGLYDARSGCVNIWCSPQDKPSCWDVEIDAGALNYPRSYVGALYWEWEEDELATLRVEVTPYDLLDRHGRKGIPVEAWEEILRWTEEKARELLALAANAPEIIGTHCPFCAYMLPTGELLNTLLAHITGEHPQEKLKAFVFGERMEIVTQNDTYPLLAAEQRKEEP